MPRHPSSLADLILARESGIGVYGFAPPKAATPPHELAAIAEQQRARLEALGPDGLVVYDIQDETARTSEPRPFPFLPTVDPERYAHEDLAALGLAKIVYRAVNRDDATSFATWLRASESPSPRLAVLVGAARAGTSTGLTLAEAYALARPRAADLVLGGIAIAERHGRRLDEHERMLAKMAEGCRFFITQAVYDVTSTKSLLSDYALALQQRGQPAVPVILSFSPCGSARTLAFMKWLGIAFPRWLDNELRFATDPLATSLELCERIFDEALQFAAAKGIPLGFNVESVSIRKVEIDASLELFRRLRETTCRARSPSSTP